MSNNNNNTIIGFAVKGIAAGIGLASESISHHKEKKRNAKALNNNEINNSAASLNSTNSSPPSYTSVTEAEASPEEDADTYWTLDEAQEEITAVESSAENGQKENLKERDISKIIDAFVQKHPLTSEELASITKLPLPVILPQKRPKDRSRGFIRAYAPVLESCAIDQPTFLDFLVTFERATQASPWIQAINLAGIAGFFVPDLTALAINAAIFITIKAVSNVQNRTRGNSFLDHANTSFFRPRGLYCLVMTWNPDSAATEERLDVNSTITSSLTQSSSGKIHKVSHNLRRSDGVSANHAIPQAAPLIFPDLEDLADQSGEEAAKKKNQLVKSKEFASGYFDKRASAKYAAKHPDSVLVQGPKPKFASRYADPTHPASSGNLVSLVTGGKINPPSLWDVRGGGRGYGGGYGGRWDVRQGNAYSGDMYGRGMGGDMYGRGMGRGSVYDGMGRGVGGLGGLGFGGPQAIKQLIKKNVMYLIVVPMPSDEEMEAAHAATQGGS